MRRAFLAAAAALIAAARLSAHANSVSYAEFSVDRDTVHAIVRLPLDDVDLLIRLDRDLDSEVSSAELDASKPAIDAYFAKHLRVAVNGAPAPHTLDRVALWRDLSEFQYLEGGLSFHTGKVAGRLTIRLDVLTELYPSHKTLGRISAAGREERFTFESASTYDRPIGTDRMTARGLVGGGAALLALLWLVRRRKGATAAAAILFAAVAHADVIMSAAGLNSTLKTMERLIRQMADAGAGGREEALFQLGAEADGLARS